MGRRTAKFTQTDLVRAIRAVEQTGAKMEIHIAVDGTIKLVPCKDTPADEPIAPLWSTEDHSRPFNSEAPPIGRPIFFEHKP